MLRKNMFYCGLLVATCSGLIFGASSDSSASRRMSPVARESIDVSDDRILPQIRQASNDYYDLEPLPKRRIIEGEDTLSSLTRYSKLFNKKNMRVPRLECLAAQAAARSIMARLVHQSPFEFNKKLSDAMTGAAYKDIRFNILLNNSLPYAHVTKLACEDDFNDEQLSVIAISPDTTLVAAGRDKIIRIYNVSTNQLIREITCDETIESLVISADNQWLVAGCDGCCFYIWDLSTGELLHDWQDEGCRYASFVLVAITNDKKNLIASTFGSMSIWNIDTHEIIQDLQIDEYVPAFADSYYPVAISPDNTFIVLGVNNYIQVWDFATRQCKHVIETSYRGITSLTISSNNKFIIAGIHDSNSTISVFSAENGVKICEFMNPVGSGLNNMFKYSGSGTISSDLKFIVSKHVDSMNGQYCVIRLADYSTILSRIATSKQLPVSSSSHKC